MRFLIPFFIFLAAFSSLRAQVFKKYPIGQSGCSAYFYCDPGTFSLEKSPDSSDVYTGECANGDTHYGLICVKFKTKIDDMQEAENMLMSYLDYLKQNLNITKAVGYGKGHRLKNREDTRGILDYWEDKDKANWKVKAWTDGKFIGVMYAYSNNELNETKINLFLEGLKLPGM